MQAKLIRDMPGEDKQLKPAGTIISHKDAWRLVRAGVAIPADEECRVKADRTPEQMTAAQRLYEKSDRGIHPDDSEAYDNGWMVGYLPNNTQPKKDALGNTSNIWQPGPKFAEYAALLEQREFELLDGDESEDDEPDEEGDEATHS